VDDIFNPDSVTVTKAFASTISYSYLCTHS